MATTNPCYRHGLAVASGGVGAGPQRCIMGSQSVLVVRWSVVRDLNPGRRSTGGRRRRKAGAPSRTAVCCLPATGNENWVCGVAGFSPPYTGFLFLRTFRRKMCCCWCWGPLPHIQHCKAHLTFHANTWRSKRNKLVEMTNRATAMLSAVYAVVVCVCVCHTPVLYQNG